MTIHADKVEEMGASPVLGSKRFRVWSEAVGDHFVIDIAEPSPLVPRGGPAPLLFITDGNMCFPTAALLSGSLSMEPGGPEPVRTVGIGYEISGNGERAEHLVKRMRDLTSNKDERFEAMMRNAPPPLTWRDEFRPGGAGRFRDFLIEELTPWLAENFEVDAEDRSLAGVSLGGLFALDTLFTQPQAFRRYVVASPSLWWADRYIFELEAEAASALKDVEARLYLAVGELEEAQDLFAKMVSNLTEFVERLTARGHPALEVRHDILAGESHMSAFGPAFGRGLRALFANPPGDEGPTISETAS